MSAYDETSRAALRAAVVKSGFSSTRASEIVDLACHAADQAVASLISVVKRAPDAGMGLTAYQLSLQLASVRMAGIAERAHDLARTGGVPSTTSSIEVPA